MATFSQEYENLFSKSPQYSSVNRYPNGLTMGDTVFPLLYVYFYASAQRKARIGNPQLFEQGIAAMVESENETFLGGQDLSTGLTVSSGLEKNAPAWALQLQSAMESNPSFVLELGNAVSTLMSKYRGRLPQNRGNYYKDTSGKYSYFPSIDSKSADNIDNIMETLRILFENKVIGATTNLGVRPINLYTGKYADVETTSLKTMNMARTLGLPTKGVFTVNNRQQTDYMFKTFSGIDMEAIASLNTVVTKLQGMTQLSWSIHRGKTSQRVIGSQSSGGRVSGSRTIAGTMIFTLADHHPLLNLLPGDYPVSTSSNYESEAELWNPIMMPDQIPPFDIILTMQNEYGYAAIVSLYGVEVVDEGSVVGVDNMITECVIQYTACAMDPIMSVRVDGTGAIDPFGLLQGGYSNLWKHREAVIAGAAYGDLEEAFESQYDSMMNTYTRRNTRRLT